MVKFRSCALALSCLAMLAAAASGQQYRPGYRTGQVQPPRRQPAQTQYGQQPQYRQPTQQRTYSDTIDESGRTRGGGVDHKIAMLLANSSKAKIKLARYALDRAESSEVRTFADALQQDHDLMLRQLRRFAPEIADSDSSSRGYVEGERRSGDVRPVRAWNETTVARQITERLVRKTRDQLSEKEGWEFDHTFVAQQLVGHQHMIAKMEVYRQYASYELRHVIEEGIQIAEGHEQEARDLVHELQRGHGRREYAESRSDESDWDDEGRVERASYEERRRESRDDDYRSGEDRSDRDRSRDDTEDDDRSDRDSDHNRRARDDDEDDEDDEDDREDRSEDDSRDRDR